MTILQLLNAHYKCHLVMNSVYLWAVQTTGNFHVQTTSSSSVLLFYFHAYGKTNLSFGKNHSLFQTCESFGLHQVSPISQMFSHSTVAISSLVMAWSEHGASAGLICCPPKGLALGRKKKC